MAAVLYPTFAKRFGAKVTPRNRAEVAAGAGLTDAELDGAVAGTFLPSLEQIAALAKATGAKAKHLTDAALDDLASKNDNKPQAPARKPVSTSPTKPVNDWS